MLYINADTFGGFVGDVERIGGQAAGFDAACPSGERSGVGECAERGSGGCGDEAAGGGGELMEVMFSLPWRNEWSRDTVVSQDNVGETNVPSVRVISKKPEWIFLPNEPPLHHR